MANVSATAVGQHLDLSRQRVRMLTNEGILHCDLDQRYDLDRARIDYLRWLRSPERRSARTERSVELQRLKIKALELKIAKEQGELGEVSEFMAIIDVLCGLVRSELGGFAARVTNDIMLRRTIDAAVFETLTRLSDRAAKEADNWKEPAHARGSKKTKDN